MKSGEFAGLRHSTNLDCTLLNRDFYWDRSQVEQYYLMSARHFTLSRRISGLNNRLDYWEELVKMVDNILHLRHDIPPRLFYSNSTRIGRIVIEPGVGWAASFSKTCTKKKLLETYAPGKTKFNSSSHGMDPDRSEMRAMLVVGGPSVASGKEITDIPKNIDLYLLMCYLLAVPPSPSNSSMSVVSQALNSKTAIVQPSAMPESIAFIFVIFPAVCIVLLFMIYTCRHTVLSDNPNWMWSQGGYRPLHMDVFDPERLDMEPAGKQQTKRPVLGMLGKAPWTQSKVNTTKSRQASTHSRTQSPRRASSSQRTSHSTAHGSAMKTSSHHDRDPIEEEFEEELFTDTEYGEFDFDSTSQASSSVSVQPRKRFSGRAASPPTKRTYSTRPESDSDSEMAPLTPRVVRSPRSLFWSASGRPSAESKSQRARSHAAPDTSLGPQGFADRMKQLLKKKEKLPLGALGRAISQHDIGAEYNTFVSSTLRNIRLDVEEAKNIAKSLSKLPEPSDYIVQRLMTTFEQLSSTVIGLTAVVDSCLVGMARLEQQQAEANLGLKKSGDLRLPEETTLAYDNLTQVWRVGLLEVTDWDDMPEAHFKSVDLNKQLEKWIRSGRARQTDQITACVDFFRKYLKAACEPPELIQRYSVRLTSSCAKSPRLLDLPEEIAEPLIGICLDGIRLGARELSLAADALKDHPTAYWNMLGETDDERAAALAERKLARRRWRHHVRGALQRALNDIRKYVKDEKGNLIPRPKVKIVHSGQHRRSSSQLYGDDDDHGNE